MKTLKAITKTILSNYSSLLLFFKLAPPERIVIIGHMRSGSSLLSHILLSNPEIVGIGETHNLYRNKRYHTKMLASILSKKRAFYLPRQFKYVMDKILHDYIVDDSMLQDETTHIILVIREPEEAIPSILHLYKKENKPYTYKDAFEHYTGRLKAVLEIKKKYDNRCFFVDYADFLVNNEPILKRLSLFLHLKEPLTSSYKLTEFTGKWARGDTSNNISSGKILSGNEKKKSYTETTGIDDALLAKAQVIYKDVKNACVATPD